MNCSPLPMAMLKPALLFALLPVSSLCMRAADNWTGSIRCEIKSEAPGYSHHETQTWTLSGAAPTKQGSTMVYPATWSVTAQGSHDRTRYSNRRIARWTADVPGPNSPVRAPVGFLVTPSGELFVQVSHAQLTRSGGYTGTDQYINDGVAQPEGRLVATVYEWRFPKIEAAPTDTQITGSDTSETKAQVGPLQPPEAQVTITFTWALGLGSAPALPPSTLPPPPQQPGSSPPPPNTGGTPPAGGTPPGGSPSTPPSSTNPPPGSTPPPVTGTTPPTTGGPGTSPPPGTTTPPAAAARLLSVTPSSGGAGLVTAVQLVGENTHWQSGITTASFGPGINVTDTLQINGPTSATVWARIDPAAATGPRTITLTTGTEVVTLSDSFSVRRAAPAITLVDPASAEQGFQGLSVMLRGEFTNFAAGSSTLSFGPGISVVSLAVHSATGMTAMLNIGPDAPVGARTVALTTGTEVATLAHGFTVTQRAAPPGTPPTNTPPAGGAPAGGTSPNAPRLLSITPATVGQGAIGTVVTLAGQGTHWLQQRPTVTVEPTVGAPITYAEAQSETELLAQFDVQYSAVPGPRTITVTTGTEVVMLPNAFTVTARERPELVSVTPDRGRQGESGLAVRLVGKATRWAQGQTSVTISPLFDASQPAFQFPNSGVTVHSLTVQSSTQATASVSIAADAPLGPYALSVINPSYADSLTRWQGFTVELGANTPVQAEPNQPAPLPDQAPLRSEIANIGAPATTASFDPLLPAAGTRYHLKLRGRDEPSIASSHLQIVVSLEQAPADRTFQLELSEFKDVGQVFVATSPVDRSPRLVHRWPNSSGSGTDDTKLFLLAVHSVSGAPANGRYRLNVTWGGPDAPPPPPATGGPGTTPPPPAGGPKLLSISPTSIEQGVYVTDEFTLTGEGTHWQQDTTTVNFGPGVTIPVGVRVHSPTSLTTYPGFSYAAAPGPRAITVTTGNEVVTLPNALTIVAREEPVIERVNPNSALMGTRDLAVTFTGRATRWEQGKTTVTIGGWGVTVGLVRVNSPTSLAAILSVDANAAAGSREVTILNSGPFIGSDIIRAPGAFTVKGPLDDAVVVPVLPGVVPALGTVAVTQVSPSSGVPGSTGLNVVITGLATHFSAGSTTANFGPGISVTAVSVASPTTATATLAIDPSATAGARTITVTTGAEVVTLANGFSVLSRITTPPADGGGLTPLPPVDSGPARDPTNFTARQTGEGQVELRWDAVPGVSAYLVLGPGAVEGRNVSGVSTTVTGVPAGLQQWTVTSWYAPDGSRTNGANWPRASTTVTSTRGRYRVTATSVRVDHDEADNEGGVDGDGRGNEIYVTSYAQLFDRRDGRLLSTGPLLRSPVHGEIGGLGGVRVLAGSWTASGGIRSYDEVQVRVPSATSSGYMPMVLWEGELGDGNEVVILRPVVWEFDANESRWYQPYTDRFPSAGPTGILELPAVQAVVSHPFLTVDTAPELVQTGPWVAGSADHPLGCMLDVGGDGYMILGTWSDRLVVITREKVEPLLTVGNGTTAVEVRFRGEIPEGNPDAMGDFVLKLKIERTGP